MNFKIEEKIVKNIAGESVESYKVRQEIDVELLDGTFTKAKADPQIVSESSLTSQLQKIDIELVNLNKTRSAVLKLMLDISTLKANESTVSGQAVEK